jgi:hypothetical protein
MKSFLNKTLLFQLHLLKTEEAVLRSHRLYPLLEAANDFMRSVVDDAGEARGCSVALLDSFTPSRDWNHADPYHLYKLDHAYVGNAASVLIAREILTYFYQLMTNLSL